MSTCNDDLVDLESKGCKRFRPACWLTGCEDNGHGDCWRCGAWIYGRWFIVATVCDPLQRRWRAVREWWYRHVRPGLCWGKGCTKRARWGSTFCSSECEDNWIPF